jgi:hypothetical protein
MLNLIFFRFLTQLAFQREGQFNPKLIPARTLGDLSSAASCLLYGWGGALDAPRADQVMVYEPGFCNQNLPQAYCSTFSAMDHATCQAYEGSPVVCNPGSIDGILLSDRSSTPRCVGEGERFILNYHSVAEYREWIETTSGVESRTKISVLAILSAALVVFGNLIH